MDEYIFLSNNCCESVNNLINNFIQVNSKVGIDRFETIIKALFIRLECIRTNNNQMGERFINKKVLYDIPMDIIRKGFWVNNKIITEDQYKKLKLKPYENYIFKILDKNQN